MTASSATPPPAVDLADWQSWFAEQRTAFDRILDQHVADLRAADAGHSRLLEAVAYSLQQGGKRLRPILVRECCQVAGGSAADATPAALAVECVHTFSLIHDDLPAMDNDDLRRGQPTNHKVFGEAVAILAGDWLVAHAFALLATPPTEPTATAALLAALGHGSLGMVEGQGADIAGEGRPTDADLVEYIHLHKTARLIETCCCMGGLSARADADAVDALTTYGRHLGLAFQIIDDLLDLTSSTEQLGKRAHKDAEVSKQTYPAAFGETESRRRAAELVADATAALEPFGQAADRLRGLAQFVIARDR